MPPNATSSDSEEKVDDHEEKDAKLTVNLNQKNGKN
jgi:hypothetical protein